MKGYEQKIIVYLHICRFQKHHKIHIYQLQGATQGMDFQAG
jgi:hypothetical protein